MRKRAGLALAVTLLLGVALSLAAVAVFRLSREPEPGFASAPREAFAVAGVDLARLRAQPAFQRLRRAAASDPAVRPQLVALTTGCGFDPIDRLATVTVAWERGAIQNAAQGWQLVASAHPRPAESPRCVAAFAQQLAQSAILPLPPIARHTTFAIAAPGVAVDPAGPQAALADDAVVVAAGAQLPHALAVLDQRAPSADHNERLRGALAALGDAPLAYALLDVQAVTLSTPQEWMGALSGFLHQGPAGASGAALFAIQALGAGLQASPRGLRLVAVAQFRTAAEAQSFAQLAAHELESSRNDTLNAVTAAETAYLARVAEARAQDPAVDAQVLPLRQAFALYNGLYDRARVRAEGATARAELEVSTQEAATLEAGLEALLACEEAFEQQQHARETPGAPDAGRM